MLQRLSQKQLPTSSSTYPTKLSCASYNIILFCSSRICQKFPSVTQDVCLYSKVMEFLSTYQYSVPSRRFIQSKFEKMTFSLVRICVCVCVCVCVCPCVHLVFLILEVLHMDVWVYLHTHLHLLHPLLEYFLIK